MHVTQTKQGGAPGPVTHSLFLQVVPHLLVLVLRQLLLAIVIVLGKYGLNLCVCVALSEQRKKQPTL